MYDLNGYTAEDYGLDEEVFEDIINEYGSVEEYYKQTNIDLSNNIKDEVYKSKKETSKFQNKVKIAFFVALAAGVTYYVFKDDIDALYAEYKDKITNLHKKGYKEVEETIKELEVDEYTSEAEKSFKNDLKGLLDMFKLDDKSKTEDDMFIRVIANYYKRSLDTLNSGKVDRETYLTKKVKDYDKIEKVVAYYDKDGNIKAYFDIASYDSMVYNTNLQRLGVRETIKDAARRNYDIVYIEPHPYSCDKCMDYQGTFISLTGKNVGQIFNGYMITDSLESAVEGGLLHPNCTHIPRKAYYSDVPSTEYTGAEWNEKYDARQKKQSLELKKQRLLSDRKIYKELGNYAEVDKINQKIKVINQNINDLKIKMTSSTATISDVKFLDIVGESPKEEKEKRKEYIDKYLNYEEIDRGDNIYRLKAMIDGKVAGTVDYQMIDNQINISYIYTENEYRRSGIASHLYKELQSKTPGKNIIYGDLTDDGRRLLKQIGTINQNEEGQYYGKIK